MRTISYYIDDRIDATLQLTTTSAHCQLSYSLVSLACLYSSQLDCIISLGCKNPVIREKPCRVQVLYYSRASGYISHTEARKGRSSIAIYHCNHISLHLSIYVLLNSISILSAHALRQLQRIFDPCVVVRNVFRRDVDGAAYAYIRTWAEPRACGTYQGVL